jgi:hypothetical protein
MKFSVAILLPVAGVLAAPTPVSLPITPKSSLSL